MIDDKTIAVVIPAYNEEKQIEHVIQTIPDFVDRIVVVNDASTDQTEAVVLPYLKNHETRRIVSKTRKPVKPTRFNYADVISHQILQQEDHKYVQSEIVNENPERSRVLLIRHLKNSGVGAAITSGYKWCRDHDMDCTCVMAGDGQMDPDELESLCRPVIEEGVDYVKGNRLMHSSSWFVMPKHRFIGNSILSILTKIASGYWRVSDTQTGYTAISRHALHAIPLFKIYKRYGMPNDMLIHLNIGLCSIREIGIKPVYHVGERSKMKMFKVIPSVSWLLFRSFFKRLWLKYFLRDFHPLFLLYHFSLILFLMSIPFVRLIIEKMLTVGSAIANNNLVIFVFFIISGIQFLLFAMWMDIQDNERLYR